MARKNRVWPVIVGAALVALLGAGMRSSFGLYLRPMTGQLGWGRGVFGLAMALQTLLMGAGTPFFGFVADRLGAGAVLAGGAVAYSLGLLWVSQAATPAGLTLSLGLLIGLAASATSMTIMVTAVGKVVTPESRTRAMGIVTAGAGAGQVLVLPTAQFLLEAYGWSRTLMVMAGLILLFVPLSLPFFAAGNDTAEKPRGQGAGAALAEAAAHPGYRLLTAGFFVCGFHVSFLTVHLPAFIADGGLTPALGATALMLVGLFNIFGSFYWGQLGTRHSKKHLLSLLYTLRALVFVVFLLVPLSTWSVLIFAATVGSLWLGTVPLTSGLVGQIFGVQYFSMLFGIVFVSHQVGGFLGAWLGGILFDRTGSYDLMWYGSIALGLASALVHLPIADKAVFAEREAGEAG
ncbi:MAG: MFS transporter [bacterium]